MFSSPNTCYHASISGCVPTESQLIQIGKLSMSALDQPTLRISAYGHNENNLPTISFVFPSTPPGISTVEVAVKIATQSLGYHPTKIAVWLHPLPTN